jgi:hypothetical protein
MVTQSNGVILRSGVSETTLSTECLASGNTFFLFSSQFNGTLFFPLPATQHPRLGLLPLPFSRHNRPAQCGPDSILLTLAAAAYACSVSPRRTKTSSRLIPTPSSHGHVLRKHLFFAPFWSKSDSRRWAVSNPASYSRCLEFQYQLSFTPFHVAMFPHRPK